MFNNHNRLINFFNKVDHFTEGLKCGLCYYLIIFIINTAFKYHVRMEVLIYIILMMIMYNKMKNHHISLTKEITTNKLKTEQLINYIIDIQEQMQDFEIQIKKLNDDSSVNISEISDDEKKCDHKWEKKCFGYDDYWFVCEKCGAECC